LERLDKVLPVHLDQVGQSDEGGPEVDLSQPSVQPETIVVVAHKPAKGRILNLVSLPQQLVIRLLLLHMEGRGKLVEVIRLHHDGQVLIDCQAGSVVQSLQDLYVSLVV